MEHDPRSLFTPVPTPNREDLRNIPVGAPTLVVNLTPEGVHFEGADWNAEDRDAWIGMLTDEEARFDSTSLFYVHPSKLAVENLPIRVELGIVDEAMQELHDLPNLSVAKVRRVLGMVVRQAREGMTVNPF